MIGALGKRILGTRGSALALWQARHVAKMLRDKLGASLEIEERIVTTSGDLHQGAFGEEDKGAFVNALEARLLAGEIDVAVHSLKDLPSSETPGLIIAAVPVREDPRDALVTQSGSTFEELPQGARVATGSPRRRGQLLHVRPDLELCELRGNIDSRCTTVTEGRYDAIVLAVAGLKRLGLEIAWQPLETKLSLPAVSQGALAVQCRSDDRDWVEALRTLEDASTRHQINAERAFSAELGGGCLAPATAWARPDGEDLLIEAVVTSLDGTKRLYDKSRCPAAEGVAAARGLARTLLDQGAAEILQQARESATDGD